MPVEYLAASRSFFLHAKDTTYAFQILNGWPVHLYWGPPLTAQNLTDFLPLCARGFVCQQGDYPLDNIPLEFPVYGTSDYRSPAIEIFQPADGSRILDLRYAGHTVSAGKPALAGLPASYTDADDEAQTLTLRLEDQLLGLRAELLYSVFTDSPVITRSVKLSNLGRQPLSIRRLLSCSVDFSAAFGDYHLLQLHGAWARERDLSCAKLHPGSQSIESRRGASSHQHNPFFALTELATSEEHGRVYAFNLVYSGNFLANVEVNYDGNPRAQLGLNPFDFSWQLEPGQSFQSPEAVLAFSGSGLGRLSRELHRFTRRHICRGAWRDRARPVLLNNWEATYFNFNADRLAGIAATAAECGVELFVLDDGWFGQRDHDQSSLGDWVVDLQKLPGGLADLVRRINGLGLQFGLWFEPEMVSPDSDLYRAHPDWCMHVPNRHRTTGRNQLVLDFSRPEVCEHIYRQIAALLRGTPIRYIKWDMNRHLTEIGSAQLPPERQQETAHRYLLGLYALMERFITEFPDILFEGCSGGGGRFDLGILHYMPQIWTSDNSDAIARLRIQHGTSLAYPLSSMAAHVSAVPNHQNHRVTPYDTRGCVAATGAFGYELDLAKLSADDLAATKRQVACYKQLRGLLANGDLYRLKSPFTTSEAAWMVVAADRREALVTHVWQLIESNPRDHYLCLRGLDPALTYRLAGTDQLWRGDALMSAGLPVPRPQADFTSTQWHLVAQ
ncbi:MAG: alpha-galactosidase [Verrucomicrobiales bacterium]|jgi:alpha-galactosidase|nr:alpha-galactosidase [Verrucomicrobiales bacterium]